MVTAYIWVAGVEVFQMWLSENAASSQDSDHIHLSIARGSCRQRVLDATFPLGAVTQALFHMKLLKVRFFYFSVMGMFLCLVTVITDGL